MEVGRSSNAMLDSMRAVARKVFTAWSWLHIPITAALCYAVGADIGTFCAATLVFALIATLAPKLAGDALGRSITLMSIIGQAAILVAALSGHPWQVDAHMYFFALMGVGVVFVDVGALLAAAAAVAVHHLGFNFFAATLVYPGGSDLLRTVMHAVILIVETAALVFAVHTIHKALSEANDSKRIAEEELANAQAAQARADAADRKAAEQRSAMLADLEASVGSVISAAQAGDLSKRAKTDYEMDALNRLSNSVNSLVERIETTISAAVVAMDRLASGDLSAKMDGQLGGRFADLQSGINSTTHKLSGLVSGIRGLAHKMEGETSKVASASSEQATRAETQASSLQETAATMEEMTATIKSNASSADLGRTSASEAAKRAERGGEVVRETMEAMGKIEEGSTRISDIISVIDGIAFQTNLLALNAAVEAARAGESGKGFAVVASEVRALAQRSADAARDINQLISQSSEQVMAGVDLVNRTGSSLDEIVEAISKVAHTVGEISSATREQSSAVDELNSAISHIDQITQENASMASESASAASALAQQGRELFDLVSAFKIEQEAASAAA